MRKLILGRSVRERAAVLALIASFIFLTFEMFLLASVGGLGLLGFSMTAAAMLSLPQLISLTAFGLSSGRLTSGIGLVGAIAGFAASIICAHDVVTSTSSTAGVALVIWPLIASAAIGTALIVGVLLDWIFSTTKGRAP